MSDTKWPYLKRRSPWKRLHRLIATIEPWGILVAAFALVLTVGQFWVDYRDRVNERVVRAWTLVTTPAPGNSGKKEALEYLNSEDGLCFGWLWGWCAVVLKSRTALVGIDLSHSRLGLSDSPVAASAFDFVGRGVYLQQANLPEADLSHANLSGANLFAANLSGATFLRADLQHTFLPMADFSEADLTGANLSGVFSVELNLFRANLFGADLSKATLVAAVLSEARLGGANLARVDLRGADLCEADLSRADLSGADLYGAFLFEADLSEANLAGANLSDANVSGADLSNVPHLAQEQLDVACAAPNSPPSVPPHLTWTARDCPTSIQLVPAEKRKLLELVEGSFTMEWPRRWPESNCFVE